jgi:hypothetical protein
MGAFIESIEGLVDDISQKLRDLFGKAYPFFSFNRSLIFSSWSMKIIVASGDK